MMSFISLMHLKVTAFYVFREPLNWSHPRQEQSGAVHLENKPTIHENRTRQKKNKSKNKNNPTDTSTVLPSRKIKPAPYCSMSSREELPLLAHFCCFSVFLWMQLLYSGWCTAWRMYNSSVMGLWVYLWKNKYNCQGWAFTWIQIEIHL